VQFVGFKIPKIARFSSFKRPELVGGGQDEPKYFILTLKKLFNYKSEIKVSRLGYECVYS
jgi:hypothetical protein